MNVLIIILYYYIILCILPKVCQQMFSLYIGGRQQQQKQPSRRRHTITSTRLARAPSVRRLYLYILCSDSSPGAPPRLCSCTRARADAPAWYTRYNNSRIPRVPLRLGFPLYVYHHARVEKYHYVITLSLYFRDDDDDDNNI